MIESVEAFVEHVETEIFVLTSVAKAMFPGMPHIWTSDKFGWASTS